MYYFFIRSIPRLIDGQSAVAVYLKVFERDPVSVQTWTQHQIDFVKSYGFHLVSKIGNFC